MMHRGLIIARYLKTFICIYLMFLLLMVSGCNLGEVHDGNLDPDYKANVIGDITVTYPLATDEESRLSLQYFSKAFMTEYEDATVNLDFSMGDTAARIASGDIGDVFFLWEE